MPVEGAQFEAVEAHQVPVVMGRRVRVAEASDVVVDAHLSVREADVLCPDHAFLPGRPHTDEH
jgi:hypothetical protein